MRPLINLVESALAVAEAYQPAYDYMNGFCHVFALAAHKLTGFPIAGFLCDAPDDVDEPTFEGCNDVIHLFCVAPDEQCFDVRGTGQNIHAYLSEKADDLGEELSLVYLDDDDIAHIVQLGWLAPFNAEDVRQAEMVAKKVLQDEQADAEEEERETAAAPPTMAWVSPEGQWVDGERSPGPGSILVVLKPRDELIITLPSAPNPVAVKALNDRIRTKFMSYKQAVIVRGATRDVVTPRNAFVRLRELY